MALGRIVVVVVALGTSVALSCTLPRFGAGADPGLASGGGGQGGVGGVADGGGGIGGAPCDAGCEDDDCNTAQCTGEICMKSPRPAGTACGDGGVCNTIGQCVECLGHDDCGEAHCRGESVYVLPRCRAGVCTLEMQRCGAFACDETAGCPATCRSAAECAGSNVCIDGGCGECGVPATPAGLDCDVACAAACPAGAVCSCDQDTCVINCDSGNDCSNVGIVCPSDYPCRVTCTATSSCINTGITCPDAYGCELQCTQQSACSGATSLVCSKSGPCSIDCAGSSATCQGAAVVCGDNSCTATCTQQSNQPQIMCGDSCACEVQPDCLP